MRELQLTQTLTTSHFQQIVTHITLCESRSADMHVLNSPSPNLITNRPQKSLRFPRKSEMQTCKPIHRANSDKYNRWSIWSGAPELKYQSARLHQSSNLCKHNNYEADIKIIGHAQARKTITAPSTIEDMPTRRKRMIKGA